MPTRTVVVEFPVTVTIEWPESIPYSDAGAIDAATSVVSQRCGQDVSLEPGQLVFAECWAEVDNDDARIIEGGEKVEGVSYTEHGIPRNSDLDGRF